MSKIKGIFEIKEKLIELNFNVSSKGFRYWIELIHIYCEIDAGRYLNEIYEEIAKNNKTKKDSVERCLRTAMKTAKERIRKYYNYKNKKISIKVVLNLIYMEVN